QLNDQTAFDKNNYIQSGLTIAVGAGLTQAPANGTAMIASVEVDVNNAPAHAFAPNRATWRDLNPDGTFTYLETFTDDFPPPVTSGALRIGVTYTDFSDVTGDRLLAATASAVGPNNDIPLQ